VFKTVGAEVKELKPLKEWNSVKRPNPNFFWTDKDVWETLVYCALNGKNVLLTGPSGCGKSEVVEMVSKACELQCEKFNMGAMSEPRTSLIGATHASKDKGTWFNESRFVRAVKTDRGIILLDEISRCERGAFNILLPLMDRQGYLALDESEDAAIIHKGALKSFCATANLGMEYTGTEALDKALQDRFEAVIEMDFPDSSAEFNVVKYRTKCEDGAVKKLIDIAVQQRNLYREGEFTTMISTRMLIATAAFINNGLGFLQSSKFGILNQFSNEGDSSSERAKLLQLIQKKGS
jgi:MoxR-like ATPase